jgi:hypothetical protein
VDAFSKKDWYDIKAPSAFQVRNVGKTLVTRSSGMRVATDFLKGRIVEANLADLNKDEDQNYRKMKLQILVGSFPPYFRRRLRFPPASGSLFVPCRRALSAFACAVLIWWYMAWVCGRCLVSQMPGHDVRFRE